MAEAQSETKFLDALATAQQTAGVYLFKQFISTAEAAEVFVKLNDDNNVPWDHNRVLGGERLNSHACDFKRSEKEIRKWTGFAAMEALCERIEEVLDGEVTDVFCNRFHNAQSNLSWHTDTYGHHIIILSLGSQRTVQFRSFKTKQVEDVRPEAGDAYFMPLKVNDTHEHRVCAADPSDTGVRISLVFFFKPPKYAKEFKISRMQKMIGLVSGVMDYVPL